jgi:hypothetical protein
MKKLKYIFSLMVLLIFQVSCTEDFLELEPKTGQVEANYYKTESDALFALTAVYDALSVQNWAPVPIMSDIFSDDAFVGAPMPGICANGMKLNKAFWMLRTPVLPICGHGATADFTGPTFICRKKPELTGKPKAFRNVTELKPSF